MSDSSSSALSPLAAEIRRRDPDRFLCALFAPEERREDLFTLYAFNLEVARIRETMREPILAQIRLQWWRDGVAAAFGTVDAVPEGLMGRLAAMVRRHGLSRELFEALLEARERDLGDEIPADLAELLGYARATSGGLVRLSLQVLGADDGAAAEAGMGVGAAFALVGLVRALRFHAGLGRVTLPQALLARHGLTREDVLAGRSSDALKQAVAELAALAQEQLAAARALRRQIPRQAVPALLPAVLAGHHLRRLARASFDPFSPALEGGRVGRQLRLALAAGLGRY